MVEIIGLTGIRPSRERIAEFAAPPYDVIEKGSELETLLKGRDSAAVFTLKINPTRELLDKLMTLIDDGALQIDNEPCFYVYEQSYGNTIRRGFLAAAKIGADIIDHEETDEAKVKGRRDLAKSTGYSFGPVFTLTKSPIKQVLDEIAAKHEAEYDFISDFSGYSDLSGIRNRIFRVRADSKESSGLIKMIGLNPLYIADGHHRYKAAALNNQTHFLAYICEAGEAKIQAYNRIINGPIKFDDIKGNLNLQRIDEFKTPEKHQFCIYSNGGVYLLDANNAVPKQGLVGKLDVSILERVLYPWLGISTDELVKKSVRYCPESQLGKMAQLVKSGEYDIAVALHPTPVKEVMDVADARLRMPRKSTYFHPKVLSGIFMMRNNYK